MQKTRSRPDTANWPADKGAAEIETEHLDLADAAPVKITPNRDVPVTTVSMVPLGAGLYAVEIGKMPARPGRISGLALPAIQVSALPNARDERVEIMGSHGEDQSWLGPDGGTLVVRSPPSGGLVLATAYGLPEQVMARPRVKLRRLDRPRSNGAGPVSITTGEDPDEIRTQIVLHLERQGDRRFPGDGWIGNRGRRLRIEAFSIVPVETLEARDIEYKALGPNGRQTPWVTNAKLCGTRGQGLPLTGFAMRLAPDAGDRFDVVYQGAFFESGIVGPHRNGELCIAQLADDPLEAINVRLVRRSPQ